MAIQLTTALDTGAIDAQDYTHVKIGELVVNLQNKSIYLDVRHGYISNNIFVFGTLIPGVTSTRITITGTDYDTLIAELTSDEGVSIYDELARVLYEWLIDNEHFAGTVV